MEDYMAVTYDTHRILVTGIDGQTMHNKNAFTLGKSGFLSRWLACGN